MAKLDLYNKRMDKLVQRIILDARLCAKEVFKSKKEFRRKSVEFQKKYLGVLFQFVYFLLDYSAREAMKIEPDSKFFFADELFPVVGKELIDMIFTESTKTHRSKILDDFNNNLDTAISDYKKCIKLFVKDDEDFTYADKRATGVTSKGAINYLADKISFEILDDYNPVTYEYHKFIVISILKMRNEYKNLISKTLNEIKKD